MKDTKHIPCLPQEEGVLKTLLAVLRHSKLRLESKHNTISRILCSESKGPRGRSMC